MTYTAAIIITAILIALPVTVGFAVYLYETGWWQTAGGNRWKDTD